MDLRVLRNFLVVARAENITRAAESLHMAQPSLSKQMMELEKELGRPLLLRGRRRLTLTEEGVLLRKRAEEMVLLMEKTRREIASGAAEISGRVSIGGSPTEALFRAAAGLREKHPAVQFDFYAGDATDVLERLDHGSLDFAVLLEPVNAVRYNWISLGDSARWGLLMPLDCPLARQPAVSREALRRVPLVFHRREGLQLEIAHWAGTEPEKLSIAATYNVVNGTPLPFVRSGLGLFLTTEDRFTSGMAPDVCFRPLEPPLAVRHALVWKRSAVFGKAAEAFLALLKPMTGAADGEKDVERDA